MLNKIGETGRPPCRSFIQHVMDHAWNMEHELEDGNSRPVYIIHTRTPCFMIVCPILCTEYKPPISREHVKAAQEEKSRRRPKKGQRRARHLFKIEKLPIFSYSRPAWFFFNAVSFEVQILVGTSVPESDFLISAEKLTTLLVTAARCIVVIYYHSRFINHSSPLNSHHKPQARKKQQQFLLA